MTNDFNNGAWWGWNGGECPVHPKTIVDALTKIITLDESVAGSIGGWERPHCNPIVAFRVVKEHREPRDWWAVGKHLHDTPEEAVAFRARVAEAAGPHHLDTPIIQVREVL